MIRSTTLRRLVAVAIAGILSTGFALAAASVSRGSRQGNPGSSFLGGSSGWGPAKSELPANLTAGVPGQDFSLTAAPAADRALPGAASLSQAPSAVLGAKADSFVAAPAALSDAKPVSSGRVASPTFSKRVIRAIQVFGLSLTAGLWTAGNQAPVVAQGPAAPAPIVAVQTAQSVLAQAERAEEAFVKVKNSQELVKLWRPDVNVYVVGSMPVSNSELRQLAGWLKGKHWYVVLVERAAGDTYADIHGNAHTGTQAYDYAIGRGIGHLNAFEALKNPQTGESDGAVLGIYWEDHGLFLRTSVAHDARGLNGEKNFPSPDRQSPTGLDRWAISELRNKKERGIISAVQETVVNIDKELGAKVTAEVDSAKDGLRAAKQSLASFEKARGEFAAKHPGALGGFGAVDTEAMARSLERAQAALDRKDYREAASLSQAVKSDLARFTGIMTSFEQSYVSAKGALVSAKSEITALETALAGFKAAFPRAAGDIAHPDVKGLQAKVLVAESSLESKPESAETMAASALSGAKAARELIEGYPGGAQQLKAAESLLQDLEGRRFAGSASSQLLQATQELRRADELYQQANSAYAQSLKSARSSLDGAESAIGSAAATHAAKVASIWTIGLLTAFGSLLAGFFMNLAAMKARKKALGLISSWETAFNKTVEKKQDELEGRVSAYAGPESGEKAFGYEGETKTLADQAREEFGALSMIWLKGMARLEEARAKTGWGPINLFFTAYYSWAERMLDSEPIEFDPEADKDLRRILTGKEQAKRDSFKIEIESLKPFSYGFQDLVKSYNTRTDTVTKNIDSIEAAKTKGPTQLKAVGEGIKSTEAEKSRLEALGQADGLFLVPSIFTTLLTAAAGSAASAWQTFKKDPVGAMKNGGQDAARMNRDAKALSDLVVAARSGPLAAVATAQAYLVSQDFTTGWIKQGLQHLSDKADALATQAVQEDITEPLKEFKEQIGKFADKVVEVEALAKSHVGTAVPRVSGLGAEVEALREEIGRALSLDPNTLLHEENNDPTEVLSAALEKLNAARESIGRGGVEAARTALNEAEGFAIGAAALIEKARKAFAARDASVKAARAETTRIRELIPERQAALERMDKAYAKSVFTLGAGDAAHPKANGTVEDNIDEATDDLDAAADKLTRAETAFREGKILGAAALLAQIGAHQEIAEHRLSEITDKEARIAQTKEANNRNLGKLDQRSAQYQVSIEKDRRVMRPTIAALEAARALLEEGRGLAGRTKGDPFEAARKIAEAQAAFDEVNGNMARNDRDIFEEAERSVMAARKQTETAMRLAKAVASDDVTDSDAIKKALQDVRTLMQELAAAELAIEAEHGDWNKLDKEADQITADAARAVAILKKEQEVAESAVAAISSAAGKIREAGAWRGGYNVIIRGTPGSQNLAHARSYLQDGRYDDALRQAESARRAAEQALAVAIAEVARLKREEEAREAAERRRRQQEEDDRRRRARASESSGGGSSSGGSWGSFSSSGGGSSSFGGGFSSSGGGSSGW